MALHRMTASGQVEITSAEESEIRAEWAANAAAKAKDKHNASLNAQILALASPFTPEQLEYLESLLPGGPGKAELTGKKSQIATLMSQKQ